MTEGWPEAPRLRTALDRMAGEVDVDRRAKDRVRAVIATEPGHRVLELRPVHPGRPESVRRIPDRRHRLPIVAWAATLLVLVAVTAVGLFSLTRDESPVEVAVQEPTSATPQAPAPERASVTQLLDRQLHCERPTIELRPFLLEVGAGTIEVGVAGGGRGSLGFFLVTSRAGWSDAAARIRLQAPLTGPTTVYYVPAPPVSEAEFVLESLFAESCNGASFLVATADGYDAALTMACANLAGRGLQGHTFVGAGGPPHACSLRHPVVLVDPQPGVLGAWEDHLGCAGALRVEDRSATVVTRYEKCETTLVAVETATSEPWLATVEGRSMQQFVVDVMTLPT